KMAAAVMLAIKSLLGRRGVGLGVMTRRELPMVAFTGGSEVTGMGAREGCEHAGEAPGETGESGTESGSISGSGSREVRWGKGWPEVSRSASTNDSGESGASGGRT